MSVYDRLADAAYTGPDGTRIPFDYVDVRETIRKRTIAHEFTDADDTYVEDQGLKGSQYPLRVYFGGADHDLAAKAFVEVLNQRGPGRLEHPLYGVHTVIPFGDIARVDALSTAGNQTVFDVTFWKTLTAIYPDADADTLQLVDDAVNSYDEAGAQQFADSLELTDPGESATFSANMRALKDGASSFLKGAQDGSGELRNKMALIDKAIDSTLDTLIGGPLTVATQMRQLITAPARSLQLARQRLDAYKNLALSLISGKGAGAGGGTGSSEAGDGIVFPDTAAGADASNLFHANRLTAEVTVLAVALAVSGETYRTRQNALDAALELATMHDDIADWSESNYAVLFDASDGPDASQPNASGVGALDVGDSRQVVLTAVTRTLSYLIATAFTLGVERSIILDVPRTAIDLVTEFYGSLDRLDEFMEANNFNSDEIFEIPPGTTVRYYVE